MFLDLFESQLTTARYSGARFFNFAPLLGNILGGRRKTVILYIVTVCTAHECGKKWCKL